MKILQVGIGVNSNKITACKALYLGFKKNNHTIDTFEYRILSKSTSIDEMNNRLFEISKNYDIIVIGKGEIITETTLNKIKQKSPEIKIVYWYGDQRHTLVDFVVNNLKYVDLFLHTSGGFRLKEYFDVGKPKIASNFIIPSDVDLFGEINNTKNKNIIFTGRDYFGEGELRKQIKNYLSKRDDSYLYGSILPEVSGNEYIKKLKQSKIGININDMQVYDKTTSNRLSHYLSCGVLGLSYLSPKLNTIFNDDEVVYFNTYDEFIGKLEFYLNNDNERVRISKNGMNKMYDEYNSKIITDDIFNILYNGKSKFSWVEIHK